MIENDRPMLAVRDAFHRRVGGSPPGTATTIIEGRLARVAGRLVILEAALVVGLGAVVWHTNASHADAVDRHVASSLYAKPGAALRTVAGVVTVLGEPALVMVISLVVGFWAWRRFGDRLLAAFCPAVIVVSATLEKIAKIVVARARPTTALLAHETGRSFPSGHATAAAALAFALSLLVLAAGMRGAKAMVSLLLVYTAAVSASRVILGVHFLTDVVAATALAGAVVTVMAWLFSRVADSGS